MEEQIARSKIKEHLCTKSLKSVETFGRYRAIHRLMGLQLTTRFARSIFCEHVLITARVLETYTWKSIYLFDTNFVSKARF